MTKYSRQIKIARKRIIRYGTTCIWAKPGGDVGNDLTPEFPELNDSTPYPDTPITLYPVTRLSEGTVLYDKAMQAGSGALFGLIPGDIAFTPEDNDAVVVGSQLFHVFYVNTTMPDGTPIVHQVGLK